MEKNSNCLEGMRCPKCKSLGPYRIAATSMFLVNDSGTSEFGDVDWEESATCVCVSCGHYGRVYNFRTKNQEERCNHLDYTDRELATILHALRILQCYGPGTQEPCNPDCGCDHFDELERLDNNEIDELCERVNFGPAEKKDADPMRKFVGEIATWHTREEFEKKGFQKDLENDAKTLDNVIKDARKLMEGI